MTTFDVITLGETMISLAAPTGTSLARAVTLDVDVAGAESNTCIGLARSGLSASWISRVGGDPFGDRILQTLAAEGVDTRYTVRDDAHPTGLMVKNAERERPHYYRSTSAARLLAPAALDGVPIEAARCVLVTGVTALISESAGDAARELLRRGRGIRAFDPNLRPGVWGSARAAELCRPLLDACSILIGGVGEIRELVGGGTLEETAQLALERGPDEVVLKQAAVGASALSRERRLDPRGRHPDHGGRSDRRRRRVQRGLPRHPPPRRGRSTLRSLAASSAAQPSPRALATGTGSRAFARPPPEPQLSSSFGCPACIAPITSTRALNAM